MGLANLTSAKNELATPMVDGIANRWIKDRISILETYKHQDTEEYSFLKRELASGNHLVTENEIDRFHGCYGGHIFVTVLYVVVAGVPLFVVMFILGIFLIS